MYKNTFWALLCLLVLCTAVTKQDYSSPVSEDYTYFFSLSVVSVILLQRAYCFADGQNLTGSSFLYNAAFVTFAFMTGITALIFVPDEFIFRSILIFVFIILVLATLASFLVNAFFYFRTRGEGLVEPERFDVGIRFFCKMGIISMVGSIINVAFYALDIQL